VSQTGTFNAEFDAIHRGVLMDGAFGLSKSSATTYNDFAYAVRFYTNGKIEARSAGAYESLNDLLYSIGFESSVESNKLRSLKF